MRIAVVLLALLPMFVCEAGETDESKQSLDAIQATARDYLEQRAVRLPRPPLIEVGRIDPRLRLAPCDRQLEGFTRPGARDVGNVTVGIRCDGTSPWTIYIAATVKVLDMVLVLNHPVSRNQQLTEQDVRLEEHDIGRLRQGFMTDPRDVIGMLARVSLQADRVLVPSVLTLPKLVQRGQMVTLLAGTPGFEVRSSGKALEDGARGDLISVKNLSSNRTVEGMVVTVGVVQVSM